MAGVVGIDPQPFTLRKLVWMAEAKERSDWNRTARLEVKIHNMQQIKEADCISFKDVHPYYMQEAMEEKQRAIEEQAPTNFAKLKGMLGG